MKTSIGPDIFVLVQSDAKHFYHIFFVVFRILFHQLAFTRTGILPQHKTQSGL